MCPQAPAQKSEEPGAGDIILFGGSSPGQQLHQCRGSYWISKAGNAYAIFFRANRANDDESKQTPRRSVEIEELEQGNTMGGGRRPDFLENRHRHNHGEPTAGTSNHDYLQ
jgi:hypothetical protein